MAQIYQESRGWTPANQTIKPCFPMQEVAAISSIGLRVSTLPYKLKLPSAGMILLDSARIPGAYYVQN